MKTFKQFQEDTYNPYKPDKNINKIADKFEKQGGKGKTKDYILFPDKKNQKAVDRELKMTDDYVSPDRTYERGFLKKVQNMYRKPSTPVVGKDKLYVHPTMKKSEMKDHVKKYKKSTELDLDSPKNRKLIKSPMIAPPFDPNKPKVDFT